jgi:hypothetical protein
MNRTLEAQKSSQFGKKGILSKRNERRDQLAGNSSNKKRKVTDANSLISSFAKTSKSLKGKDAFKKALHKRK